MRRFFCPSLRLPLPVFLTPMLVSKARAGGMPVAKVVECPPVPVQAPPAVPWAPRGERFQTDRPARTPHLPPRVLEMLVLFPTYGRRIPGDDRWRATAAGMVVRPLSPSSGRRRLAMAVMRRLLDLDESQLGEEVFRRRADAFLFRRVAGATVGVTVEGTTIDVGPTDRVGHFVTRIDLSPAESGAGHGGVVRYHGSAREPRGDGEGDPLEFRGDGRIHLVGSEGLSVISDIDDTVKVTDVGNRRELLANTLFREFRAVPGMPEVYREWAAAGAAFHYVSSSPWQLAACLDGFFASSGIPAGSMHLTLFRLKDSTPLGRLGARKRSKRRAIEQILEDFPRRRFLLVGDSGERDPEVYAAVARRHPERVHGVIIRRLAGHAPAEKTARRLERLARRLPRGMFRQFSDPEEIRRIVADARP